MENDAKKNNRITRGQVTLLLGVACLLAAGIWFGVQKYQEYRAGVMAEEILSAVLVQPQYEQPEEPVRQEQMGQKISPAILEHVYGVIHVPDLEIQLPVLDTWNYDELQLAPCRYSGDAATGDLVLLGHNYAGHFAALETAQVGQSVRLTLEDGTQRFYTIDAVRQVEPTETEAVEESGYPLTIFTCTKGGQRRWVFFCKAEEA